MIAPCGRMYRTALYPRQWWCYKKSSIAGLWSRNGLTLFPTSVGFGIEGKAPAFSQTDFAENDINNFEIEQ